MQSYFNHSHTYEFNFIETFQRMYHKKKLRI